jgi:hypothetical protein
VTPAQGATLCAYAEAAYKPGVLYPVLPDELTGEWDLINHFTALDALLALQKFGYGERVFYGWLLRSKADPLQYVAVLRGTETPKEWLLDALAVIVNHVHLGFSSIHGSMEIAGAHPSVSLVNLIPPGATVWWLGHSLGAPLACYGMNDMIGQRDCYGMFYAMPKPGDEVFASQFKASEARYSVFNYEGDEVPTLPRNLPLHRFVPLHDVTTIPSSQLVPDDIVSNHQASNYALLLQALQTGATP